MFKFLKPLWLYRSFIFGSIKREFQAKYRNSMFGAVWTIINPLSMIIIYTVVFSQLMKAKFEGVDSTFSFGIYLCSGILTWGLFAEITQRSTSVFLENANLLKKVNFPRICLPTIIVLSSCLNFTIIFGLFILFLVISGNFPGWIFFTILPVLVIQILFSIGLGMILGVLNVFFRDVGQFYSMILQFWFWLTPIIYPLKILPIEIQTVVNFNPMAHLVAAYQAALVFGNQPIWGSLLYPTILAMIFIIIGFRFFRRHVAEIVDEI